MVASGKKDDYRYDKGYGGCYICSDRSSFIESLANKNGGKENPNRDLISVAFIA